MTAKEYLSEVQRLKRVIDRKLERMGEIRESGISVQTVQYSFEKTKTNKRIDRVGNFVGKTVDMENEIKADVINLLYLKHRIINQIQGLNNILHIQVLFKRHIEGKDFRTIAKETGISKRYSLKIHKEALENFERVYETVLQNNDKQGWA